MTTLFGVLMLLFASGCNESMQVTGHPDDHSSTSGTLGSSKAENQLPKETGDTEKSADTVIRQKR